MLEPLLVAAEDEDETVRRLAIFTLSSFAQEDRAIAAILASLGDREWKVRRIGAYVLGQIGDTRAIPELMRLAQAESHPQVRETVTASLNAIQAREILRSGGDLGKAETLVLAAVQHDPDNAVFHDLLGYVLYEQGRYAEAIAELEQSVAYQQHLAPAHYHLSLAYLQISKLERGFQELETVLGLDPSYREVIRNERDLARFRNTPEYEKLIISR